VGAASVGNLRDLVFTERAIRRALGIAILGGLVSGFAYVKRSNLLEQAQYLTADEEMWTAWVDTGALVAVSALVFVALGLIVGRPPVRSATDSEAAGRPRV